MDHKKQFSCTVISMCSQRNSTDFATGQRCVRNSKNLTLSKSRSGSRCSDEMCIISTHGKFRLRTPPESIGCTNWQQLKWIPRSHFPTCDESAQWVAKLQTHGKTRRTDWKVVLLPRLILTTINNHVFNTCACSFYKKQHKLWLNGFGTQLADEWNNRLEFCAQNSQIWSRNGASNL